MWAGGDNFTVSDTRGRIIEENHYYAFGLKIAGISSVKFDAGMEGSLKNNNLYNDKELWDDADLDWYDYGYRNYDAQIGRFTQLDPLTWDYPELTNYQYASNDPILNIDLDGLEGAVSNVSKVAETAVTTSGTLLSEVKIFAVLPKVAKAAKAGTSLLSKAAIAMNAVGKGIGWFANGLWNEGVMPTLDWVNHNVNPVYGVFNGINSQFTQQDFFNGTSMTHAEGITDAALPFIPFGKVGGVVEKTVFKVVEKVAAKEETKLITQFSTSTIDDAVGLVMKDPNKISHLFAGKHNLDGLVTKFGGQESTVRAVLNAANGKLPASGVFNNISISVGGQNLLIRGSVINGVPRLGTMFIP